jgi:serine/threonine protein kinase
MRYRPYVTQDTWVIAGFDSAVLFGEKFMWDGRAHDYISPEFARARMADKELAAVPSVDVWGLGRILYFMATPFPFWPADKTDEAIITQLAAGQFTLRRDLFDKPTLRVMDNLLKDKPEERWRLDRLKTSAFITGALDTEELKKKDAEVLKQLGLIREQVSSLDNMVVDTKLVLGRKIDADQQSISEEPNSLRTLVQPFYE